MIVGESNDNSPVKSMEEYINCLGQIHDRCGDELIMESFRIRKKNTSLF